MEFIRLSHGAQQVMAKAADHSNRLKHYYLGVEHLFIALHDAETSSVAKVLAGQGLDLDHFFRALEEGVTPATNHSWGAEILFTPRCRQVLNLAGRIAAQGTPSEVEKHHILEAILQEGRSIPVRLLRTHGINLDDLRDAVGAHDAPRVGTTTPTLDRFGRDLTALALSGTLSPVIGRDEETDLLIQVLLRRNKNNPVLIGEAGVGKTAVVEGFAQRLISEQAPQPLKGCRVIELSVGGLIAGTKYRGDFEERLLTIVREAASDDRIVLFLDEIHTLVGAGASTGDALDASNIFKPALARGEIRCIGATTIDEYRRHIEKDPALDRRFETISVEEPSAAEARLILKGLAPSLESHHQVKITPEAVEKAVDLSVRYMPNHRLPDKAIDALDQTCARVRLRHYNRSSSDAPSASRTEVGGEDVARTVSQRTGLPLQRISGAEAKQLLHLEQELRERVVGQKHAVQAVSRAILTSRAGLSDPNRPFGVFLFLGPTGVGKTELAKSLAHVLFGDEKKLTRFDMSEFTEAHSVAKLIGAPPGYVGHDTEGVLISAVRTHPNCVLLFDEMEKAHPQIFDLFLQIFDEGQLTGSQGKKADFTQSVVILTSNVNPRPEVKSRLGFVTPPAGEAVVDPRAFLTQFLRPELVNRIDEVVTFNALGPEQLRSIIDRFVNGIEELAATRKLELKLETGVRDFLIGQSAPERFGARELRRVIDRHLRQPLAAELLRRGDRAGTVHVRVRGGALQLD